MSQHEHDLTQAEQHCKDTGKRLTQKRKQVLSVLLQLNKAASAYDIQDSYKAEFGEVLPPMSIYRILEFLEQEHFVHKLRVANKYVACAHIHCDKEHHAAQFFICTVCGKVKEVDLCPETFAGMQNDSSKAGFHIDVPQLEFNCICHECQ